MFECVCLYIHMLCLCLCVCVCVCVFVFLFVRNQLNLANLHDLVENYTEITPKLHAKNATQAAHKIGRGASRRGQFWASGVSRFLRAILA